MSLLGAGSLILGGGRLINILDCNLLLDKLSHMIGQERLRSPSFRRSAPPPPTSASFFLFNQISFMGKLITPSDFGEQTPQPPRLWGPLGPRWSH